MIGYWIDRQPGRPCRYLLLEQITYTVIYFIYYIFQGDGGFFQISKLQYINAVPIRHIASDYFNGPKCLTFFYHMNAFHGSLTVGTRDSTLFQEAHVQRHEWRMARIPTVSGTVSINLMTVINNSVSKFFDSYIWLLESNLSRP